jgi:hypothetical protein
LSGNPIGAENEAIGLGQGPLHGQEYAAANICISAIALPWQCRFRKLGVLPAGEDGMINNNNNNNTLTILDLGWNNFEGGIGWTLHCMVVEALWSSKGAQSQLQQQQHQSKPLVMRALAL